MCLTPVLQTFFFPEFQKIPLIFLITPMHGFESGSPSAILAEISKVRLFSPVTLSLHIRIYFPENQTIKSNLQYYGSIRFSCKSLSSCNFNELTLSLKCDHIKDTSGCVSNLSLLLPCEQIVDICSDRHNLLQSPKIRTASLGLIHWNESESGSFPLLFACK